MASFGLSGPRSEGDQRKPGDSIDASSHRAGFQRRKFARQSIRQIETRPATEADLEAVTSALQRLDPIWEVLYPEERRRGLELLVDEIDVSKTAVNASVA